MTKEDRIIIAREAASAVINTLSNNDFLGVISFSSTASTVYSSTITRATIAHKAAIIEKVGELYPTGQTNFEDAIRLGFSMLNAATKDEYGAPCLNGENIFLFLTDGEPTAGLLNSADLISLINSYNMRITMFTYALGSEADTSILHDMAC